MMVVLNTGRCRGFFGDDQGRMRVEVIPNVFNVATE